MITPLVSICIPTFNGELFIRETIDCVLKQDYKPLEIIVSDDHSTDRTLEIIEELLTPTDLTFKIFRHDRLGLGNNWNYCIKNAQGKYIKFLLQDDRIYPECISKLVELFEKNPHKKLGMVFCLRQINYNDDLKLDQVYHNLTKNWSKLEGINYGYSLLNDPNLLTPPLNKIGEPTNTLILRSVFDRVGEFDPNLHQLIDLDMWLRIMGHYQIGFVNQVLAEFRVHRGQFSYINSNSGNAWLDSWRLFFKMLSHSDYEFLTLELKQTIGQQCLEEMTNITTELYKLRTDNHHLNQQVATLGKSNKSLGEEIERIGQQLTETHERLTEAQSVFLSLTQTEAKLQNLRQELEKVYQLYQTSAAEVQSLSLKMTEINTNLQDTQAKLAESNSLVAAQQGTIDYLTNALEQISREKAGIETDRDQKIILLRETETELAQKKIALEQSLSLIRAMESSKFWQLRNKWIKLKQRFGLPTE